MSMSIKNFSNKKRNIFLCALLSCSAIGTSSFVQAETLAAKTSWAVSRVVSSSQGSYCTMAQRYADDTTLTLARNMAGEFSLAIDFKKDQFKKSGKQNLNIHFEHLTKEDHATILHSSVYNAFKLLFGIK